MVKVNAHEVALIKQTETEENQDLAQIQPRYDWELTVSDRW